MKDIPMVMGEGSANASKDYKISGSSNRLEGSMDQGSSEIPTESSIDDIFIKFSDKRFHY